MNKIILVLIIILIVVVGGIFILKAIYPEGVPYQANIEDSQQAPANNQPQIPADDSGQVPNGQDQSQATVNVAVSIKSFAFNPSVLTVKAGTTVVWTNEDSAPHTIKSDLFTSNNLNKGDFFAFKFANVGTYDYICSIHPSMKGQIIVE